MHLLLTGVAVGKDRYAGARRCVDLLNQGGFFHSRGDDVERSILESPYFAIGTEGEICDQLINVRRTFGISYFSVRESVAKEFAPIVAGALRTLMSFGTVGPQETGDRKA